MSTTKYDIENFNGRNDFGLWKMKMEAILIQQGITLLSDKDLLESMIEKERQEVQRKAYNSIILSLSDQVMRKVSHEKTVVGVWKKLEELYRTQAFPNCIYLKEHLYGFKIEEFKPIDDVLDEFNKLVLDLESLDIKHFKETLKYGRDAITFDDVQNALNAKVLDMKSSNKTNSGESLISKDKKYYRDVKCYHCNKMGHIRRICPDRQEEENTQAQGSVAIIDDGYDSVKVLLGNNISCSVVGIGTVAINMLGIRLDHLGDRGLKELHKQGLLCGDSINKIDFCQYCILGKQHRTNTAGTKEDSENRSLTLDKDHFEFEVELSSQDGHDQQNDLAHGGLETEDTKAKRNIKPLDRFGFIDLIAYALLTTMEYEESEPLSYQEAINNNESMKWLTSMTEEFESL
ncbi:hypothetical protein AAG906_020364 [Vitis piasezkii]